MSNNVKYSKSQNNWIHNKFNDYLKIKSGIWLKTKWFVKHLHE